MNQAQTAVALKAINAARPLEGVGGDIVGHSPPAGDREGDTPGALPVAAKKRRRGIAISATCPPDQVSVASFTHASESPTNNEPMRVPHQRKLVEGRRLLKDAAIAWR